MTAATAPDLTDPARAYEMDRAHVFHSWSAQVQLDPMVFTGNEHVVGG